MASFLLTTASFTIKVVYDHTRIVSYQRWSWRNAGQLRVRLLVHDGRSAELAGGLPNSPILSGLSRTGDYTYYSFSVSLFYVSTPRGPELHLHPCFHNFEKIHISLQEKKNLRISGS
jgi:hypothetical protein